ncbi:protein FAR1-RELATED SEQUENCE 5-like [Cornus florida]|uniref:protein FAR1-RELATED SEQUENCE 5-like n=1 Tax=Cornus florida TaxID=4283 RepID=UPI0028998667|nr:protein FAR1-RELATED SEQUENCE 5-like [Cornus florida]
MVYGRHTFTADMKSTKHSESKNNALKNYLKPSHNLLRFFEHYESVLNDRRYEKLCADFNMMRSKPVLLTSVEMLRHSVKIYTPKVFELFQKEYMRFSDYCVYKVAKDRTKVEYKVSYVGKSQGHVVNFEASIETVMCSCMKFTFIGILCIHTLKVLDKKNIKKIPPQYIMKRWTRDVKARTFTNYHGIEANDNPKVSLGKRYSHLCRNFYEISSLALEHEKLYVHANDRALVLHNDLEELKKQLYSNNVSGGESSIGRNEEVDTIAPPKNCVPIWESQIGLRVETPSASHSMMNYDNEKAITNRQPNMFYIRLLQESHYGNLSQTAQEGNLSQIAQEDNPFENFPPC